MKKLINKTWAKITAFCLLFVFTILAAAGIFAVGKMIDEGVYSDGGKRALDGIYRHECAIGAYDAWNYLLTSQADNKHIPTVSEFADNFADSDCSIAVYRDEGTVVYKNYDIDSDDVLMNVSESGDYNGEHLTIVSSLRKDFVPSEATDGLELWCVTHCGLVTALTVISAAAAIFCLVFTLSSAGHWEGYDGIHLTWFDKIPADLWIAVIVLVIGIPYNTLEALPFAAAVLLLFLPTFAAQCKAGTVISGSVCAWLFGLLKKFIKWLFAVIRGVPVAWKTAAAAAIVLLVNFYCALMSYSYTSLITVMFIFDVLVALLAIYIAICMHRLLDGGKRLAEGDFDTPVDTKGMFGDLKRHGEDLNAAQRGIRIAVDERTKSERMKTELITNVSHDIKTPLTSIVNYVDLLKKENISDETARDYIDVLDRQSGRLKKLIEDLVEASKAASGSINVNLENTDVNVFLTQAVGEYGEKLDKAGVEPVLTLDESAPHAMADGRLLWRVMDNLLSNVCKYALPGTRVYISDETGDEAVIITLKNISKFPLNISADELTERFVRGDSSRSTEGSGLGLSIASGLTEVQGGHFSVDVDGDLFKARIFLPLL